METCNECGYEVLECNADGLCSESANAVCEDCQYLYPAHEVRNGVCQLCRDYDVKVCFGDHQYDRMKNDGF